MGKASKRKAIPARKAPTRQVIDIWKIAAPAVLVIVTLACYWTPMTSNATSILWDAADYYQVVQNHLSIELHAGRIPFWTPYPWSGYPFLADPQVGAWYPLNWPFFLIGVSPHVLVLEHWLHALLAAFGAYFLAFRLIRFRPGAVIAGLCYGLSGFYVGHSSHTTMLQCAAWTPWLMLSLDRALASRPVRNTLLGGVAAGLMILAGHFQTILYSFAALALFAAARVIAKPRRWLPILGIALAIPVIGTLLSAIGTLPGLELVSQSIRASLAAVGRTEGIIPWRAFATLFYPNYYNLFSDYTGPADITQFYFYAGFLLVPLAIAGLRNSAVRWAGILLVVPTIWYAMGQSAGLYLLIARLPGFSSVRAPVNIWFVPALGLSLLAASGLAAVSTRWPAGWLPAAIIVVFCADLFWFQSATNPLAYARVSYDEVYTSKEDIFHQTVATKLAPLTRFDAPEHTPVFGPMSHFFDQSTEVTYGYGPLVLARYSDYQRAMQSNSGLRNGLNVSLWLDQKRGGVVPNPDFLPRANFPKELVKVQSSAESNKLLRSLDQRKQALVPAAVDVKSQDANGTADVIAFSGGHYRIHYRCAAPSVLRIGNAYFPGWRAHAGSRELDVFPVDHALLGTVVPAGEGEVDFDYHSRFFPAGLAATLICCFACGALLWWDGRTYRVMPPHVSLTE